jgi:hypothetical protein
MFQTAVGRFPQRIPQPSYIGSDRFVRCGGRYSRPFGGNRKMPLNELLKIEVGVVLVRLVVGKDRPGRFLVLQVCEGFPVRKDLERQY